MVSSNRLAFHPECIPVSGPNVPGRGLRSAKTLTWEMNDFQGYCKSSGFHWKHFINKIREHRHNNHGVKQTKAWFWQKQRKKENQSSAIKNMALLKLQCCEDIVELLIGWSLYSLYCRYQMEDDRAVRLKSHDLFMILFPWQFSSNYNNVHCYCVLV